MHTHSWHIKCRDVQQLLICQISVLADTDRCLHTYNSPNKQTQTRGRGGAYREREEVGHGLQRRTAVGVHAAPEPDDKLGVDDPLDVGAREGEQVREALVPRGKGAHARRVLAQAQRDRLQQPRRAVPAVASRTVGINRLQRQGGYRSVGIDQLCPLAPTKKITAINIRPCRNIGAILSGREEFPQQRQAQLVAINCKQDPPCRVQRCSPKGELKGDSVCMNACAIVTHDLDSSAHRTHKAKHAV